MPPDANVKRCKSMVDLVCGELWVASEVILTAIDYDLARLVGINDLVLVPNDIGQARPSKTPIQDLMFWKIGGNIGPFGK